MLPGYAGAPVRRLLYSYTTTGCNNPQHSSPDRPSTRTLTVAITNPSKRRDLPSTTPPPSPSIQKSAATSTLAVLKYVAVDEIDVVTYLRELAISNHLEQLGASEQLIAEAVHRPSTSSSSSACMVRAFAPQLSIDGAYGGHPVVTPWILH